MGIATKPNQPTKEITTCVRGWHYSDMISTLSTERNLVAVDTFPGESRVFDRSIVEHHSELDYEHVSVIKTKPNQPKSLSNLDETRLVIPRAFAKNKVIGRGWPEQHSPSMTITLRGDQFQVGLHLMVSMIPTNDATTEIIFSLLYIHLYIRRYTCRQFTCWKQIKEKGQRL